MLDIGNYNLLKVSRMTEGRYYLETDTDEILLVCDTRKKKIDVGQMLEVFVYLDKDGSSIATLSKPYAIANQFAYLKVVGKNNFGAYMDWGIEQDLFVYSKAQDTEMNNGESHVVFIRKDKFNNKIQGTSFLEQYADDDTSSLRKGEKVSLLIYRFTEIGIMAIVNQRFAGMLYVNECFEKLDVGDIREGFIKKLRDDGKLDLTLQGHIVKVLTDSQQVILDMLKEAGGFLPYHDKSNADQIKNVFSMSKKNFKKAVGGLYKERKIYIAENGISLI